MKKIFLYSSALALIGLFMIVIKKMNYDNYLVGLSELRKLNKSDSAPSTKLSHRFCYIAHAGGGYRGLTYLNTLEAVTNSYNLGMNYLEVDVNYSVDSVPLLDHDYVSIPSADFVGNKINGTRMTLEGFLEWVVDKKIIIITDIKTRNLPTLKSIATRHPELIPKIIPQAYSISEIGEIKKMGYENVIFTNYVAQYPFAVIKRLASTNHTFAITLPYDINFKFFEAFADFSKFKTPIFTHTINDETVLRKLQLEGCRGIYTDVILKPSN